jgi:hypothetical protein
MMDNNRHADEHRVVRLFATLPWVYFAVLVPMLGVEFSGSRYYILSRFDLPILLLPWAAGILLLAIGRAGPLKNWAVPWLISFSFPAVIIKYGVHLTRMGASLGSTSSPAVVAFFFVVPALWYLQFLARMSPKRCPGCGRASSIPLMKIGKQDQRSANTRWCAGCGAKYWRDRQGVWKVEKRTTWYDREMRQGESKTAGAAARSGPPAPAAPWGRPGVAGQEVAPASDSP